MAVFRVEKNKGYTVMSNHHLRNAELTLKSKGLLSQMLSLPENWDYTLKGLSHINKESIDAIRTAIWELEGAGYITRQQGRDDKGKMTAIEYTIYEQPQRITNVAPELCYPILENPITGKPMLENPTSENPTLGNPTQLNIDISSKELSNTDKQNTDLSSIESYPIPSSRTVENSAAVDVYREIILDNIGYRVLVQRLNRERLDEIVAPMLETLCSARKTIRVARDDYPAELVKAKLLKLDSTHIEYVFECLDKNTTEIHNIKKYLLAVLFNAPSTIDSYYTAQVNHDMESEGWR